MRKYFKLFGGLGALALIAGLSIGAYAFTNQISMPSTVDAGYGSGTLSGFTISSVANTLSTDSPPKVNSVAFTISPAPAAGDTFYLILDNTYADRYACTNVGTAATCTAPSTAVTLDNESTFNVVVSQ